jgi:hypothetical protein
VNGNHDGLVTTEYAVVLARRLGGVLLRPSRPTDPTQPTLLSGPRRALGSLLKSRLWSFGNSVRQHEGHSTRGSRTINDDVTAFQPGAFASTAGKGALEVLWAIGPAAYHTTNASPDRRRLAIGEMTQDAF